MWCYEENDLWQLSRVGTPRHWRDGGGYAGRRRSRYLLLKVSAAEIELAALAGACLRCRLPSQAVARRQIAAWKRDRNAARKQITWTFTTSLARVKLDHLYPAVPGAADAPPAPDRAA